MKTLTLPLFLLLLLPPSGLAPSYMEWKSELTPVFCVFLEWQGWASHIEWKEIEK